MSHIFRQVGRVDLAWKLFKGLKVSPLWFSVNSIDITKKCFIWFIQCPIHSGWSSINHKNKQILNNVNSNNNKVFIEHTLYNILHEIFYSSVSGCLRTGSVGGALICLDKEVLYGNWGWMVCTCSVYVHAMNCVYWIRRSYDNIALHLLYDLAGCGSDKITLQLLR